MKKINRKTKGILNLLNFISSNKIEGYVKEYKADFSANKLHSIIFLKLFLYSWMIEDEKISLGNIAKSSRNKTFKKMVGLERKFSIAKSSLSERFSKIPFEVFKDIFEDIASQGLRKHNNAIKRTELKKLIEQSRILDSTIITLSSKLLKTGYRVNDGQKTIKSSIAINGNKIPVEAMIFSEQTYSSEERALVKLIDFDKKGIIYIFDRGIRRLKTYAEIDCSGNYFVSRLSAQNYSIISTKDINKESKTLYIIKEEIICFERLKNKEFTFKLITAKSKKDNQIIKFITNLKNVNAKDITELYKYRWSIEVFFRFLKSNLRFDKLLSYNENGIKVHIYLALIVFILNWIYKEQNNIFSFKAAREALKYDLLKIILDEEFKRGFLAGSKKNKITVNSS